jgi:predicted nucleotidyltransferase
MTKTADEEINKIKVRIAPTLRRNDVKKAAIFGSYAWGEARRPGDVDLLVAFNKPKGPGFAKLKLAPERILKRNVDLLTYTSINPHIRREVLDEAVRTL